MQPEVLLSKYRYRPAGHASVGDAVGTSVGDAVGASVGDAVGASVGDAVGAAVGAHVPARIVLPRLSVTGHPDGTPAHTSLGLLLM